MNRAAITPDDDHDVLRDSCGVAAVCGHPEAANLVYLALYALQHRGQESAGIVAADGAELRRRAGMGHVAEVFTPAELAQLPGPRAIGHVRYGTAGASSPENAQPLMMLHQRGAFAVGHNGNLTNAITLRTQLERSGSIFRSTTDTEVLLHLVARSRAADMVDAVVEALAQVEGAYCFVLCDERRVVAARDPYGVRPLALGRLPGGGAIVASETCAFDLVGAQFEREIEPGELLVIDEDGRERSLFPLRAARPAPCIFEFVYFARPDSRVFGRSVSDVRHALGRELAAECPVAADVVVPVPDSGVPSAIGFARAAGIPFDVGLTRNHYVGRTFIEPAQSIRHFGVKVKLNPVRAIIEGRRVALVDDSLVRGTTMRKIVTMVREAGAAEVHVRISCPPIVSPCYYGVDMPSKEELVASRASVEEIRGLIGADTLGYLSLEGMHRAADAAPGAFCAACWTGHYPVPVVDPVDRRRHAARLKELRQADAAAAERTQANEERGGWPTTRSGN